mmetsp:Transcript_45281/g.75127  ORF Transcript_45281/g.75127 Transcript_45281/m.75127 type:complete len:204 (-) Transcript_45281:1945-2556(-)
MILRWTMNEILLHLFRKLCPTVWRAILGRIGWRAILIFTRSLISILSTSLTATTIIAGNHQRLSVVIIIIIIIIIILDCIRNASHHIQCFSVTIVCSQRGGITRTTFRRRCKFGAKRSRFGLAWIHWSPSLVVAVIIIIQSVNACLHIVETVILAVIIVIVISSYIFSVLFCRDKTSATFKSTRFLDIGYCKHLYHIQIDAIQ